MKKQIMVVLAALAILAAGAYPLLARPQGTGRGFFSGQGQYMDAPTPDAYNNSRGWFQGGYGRGMGMYHRTYRDQSRADTWRRGNGNTGRGGYGCPFGGRW